MPANSKRSASISPIASAAAGSTRPVRNQPSQSCFVSTYHFLPANLRLARLSFKNLNTLGKGRLSAKFYLPRRSLRADFLSKCRVELNRVLIVLGYQRAGSWNVREESNTMKLSALIVRCSLPTPSRTSGKSYVRPGPARAKKFEQFASWSAAMKARLTTAHLNYFGTSPDSVADLSMGRRAARKKISMTSSNSG